MYKFYQEGSSENEKNEDPEGVKMNVDNKNEKVSFVKENRVVQNLMNAKSEDVGTFVNMRPYAKDAGDAHETRPYIDTNQRLFEDLNEADMWLSIF